MSTGHRVFPTQGVALYREATPLIVVQPKPATTELLSKNAVLIQQVIDDLQLMTVHPAGEKQQEEVECVQ